jgi:hypothetical protein
MSLEFSSTLVGKELSLQHNCLGGFVLNGPLYTEVFVFNSNRVYTEMVLVRGSFLIPTKKNHFLEN